MLSAEVEYSINTLFRDARDKRHEFVTVEHLLLAMLDNPSAAEVLRAVNADIPQLRRELEQFVNENTPLIPMGDSKREVQPTQGFQRVIHRAIYSAQSARKGEVTGDVILVSIFGEPDSHAVYFLARQDVARLDVVHYVAHGLRKDDEDARDEQRNTEANSNSNQGEDAEMGDEVEVTTVLGRTEVGELVVLHPVYTHTFGGYVKEISEIHQIMDKEFFGGGLNE